MGEAKRRRASDPNYGKRPKFGRGLVISNPVEVDPTNNSILSKSARIDPQELRFALLFWDKLAWPINDHIRIAGGPDEEFLEKAGILKRPFYNAPAGPVATIFAAAHMQAFYDLEKDEPGGWALAEGEQSFFLKGAADQLVQNRGMTVKLYKAIPVPQHDIGLDDLLEFKERRLPELLDLRAKVDQFAEKIASSRDPYGSLLRQSQLIDQACADVLRVSREQGLPIGISDLKCTFEFNLKEIFTGATAAIAAQNFGLDATSAILSGVAAGIAAGLKIEGDVGLHRKAAQKSPFRYVYRFHNELRP